MYAGLCWSDAGLAGQLSMVMLVDKHMSIKAQHILVLVIIGVSTFIAADQHTSIQNTTYDAFTGEEQC